MIDRHSPICTQPTTNAAKSWTVILYKHCAKNARNAKESEVGIGDGRGTVLFGNPTSVLILSDPSDMLIQPTPTRLAPCDAGEALLSFAFAQMLSVLIRISTTLRLLPAYNQFAIYPSLLETKSLNS